MQRGTGDSLDVGGMGAWDTVEVRALGWAVQREQGPELGGLNGIVEGQAPHPTSSIFPPRPLPPAPQTLRA